MGGDSAGGNLVGALLMLIRQMRLEKELKIMHGTNTNSKTHTSIKKTKTERPVLMTPWFSSISSFLFFVHLRCRDLTRGRVQNRPAVEIDAETVQAMAKGKGKGKEVNEPEQIVDETSKQEQERLQDEGELEFDDEDEEEAEKERQLHRQLGVRRQSMADFKSSAERARQRVTKEKQAKHNRKASSAEGRRVKRKEKVDTPSQTTDDDEAALEDGDDVNRDALEGLDGGDEAASLPTLKAIGFDMELVRRHRIPFELDEDQAGKYPSMPLAAMQISPWIDVSENSSVHSPESWGQMKFRPYNISVR
jgi:hypothetical protein